MAEPLIEKGKKGKGKKRGISERIVYHVNAGHINDHAATPQHEAARGAMSVAKPECGKAGNPFNAAVAPDDRLSEPITAGHAAISTGDYGAGAGRSRELAYRHPDLRQSNTSFNEVIARLHTERGDRSAAEIGLAGFAYQGTATVHHLDAAGEAGSYIGMRGVNPSPARPDYHQARGSATPATPGHSLDNPISRPKQSMKSSPLDIMKSTMRVISG